MIQRSCIFGLLDEKKDGEEKGGKHFVKENIWKANEMRNREKKGKYLEKEDIYLRRRRRMERENEECIERREILSCVKDEKNRKGK